MSNSILIVDDSRVQLMLVSNILKEVFPQYDVLSYTSPINALEEIKSKGVKIHFALIDYNMEGMSGIELIEQLLHCDFSPVDVSRVSLLSANIQEAVQNKASDLGVDFIAKPFDREKLVLFLDKKGISHG